jgi:hypothetical protein
MDIAALAEGEKATGEGSIVKRAALRLRPLDRQRKVPAPAELDRLVAADHPVRAIWQFVSRLDVTPWLERIRAVEGRAGRPPWDPRIVICLWVWGYAQGVGRAREISHRCGFDPTFQWLAGGEVVNYHTLSSFRVIGKEFLTDLFVNVLGVLSAEGLVTLERVMHDGMKVKACAGIDTFRSQERIEIHLQEARRQIESLDTSRDPAVNARQAAARRRAARERIQRLEAALQQFESLPQPTPAQRKRPRVSETDPDARIMKQSDGGFAPSLNAQISTDQTQTIIVAAEVTRDPGDSAQLLPAADRIEQNTAAKPKQIVADGGFTNRNNVVGMNEKGIEFIGSLTDYTAQSAGQLTRQGIAPEFAPSAFTYDPAVDRYLCPAGHPLRREGKENRPGATCFQYRAEPAICGVCPHQTACCPANPSKGRAVSRVVEDPVVTAFGARMQTDEARAIYKLRGQYAEFPNAWIKAKLGLRQFHVRGLLKAGMELIWVVLTYNIQQWIRLRWHPEPAAATA